MKPRFELTAAWENMQQIELRERQIFEQAETKWSGLLLHSGILRIAGHFPNSNSDVTLAILDAGSRLKLDKPIGCSQLRLEAITTCALSLEKSSEAETNETINQWLINLHLVRQLVRSESRLIALLQLLIEEFGFRHRETYSLPFWLSHARIAEMISSSRSTVTRQLQSLREQNDVFLSPGSGGFVISNRLMELSPSSFEAQSH